MNPVTIVCRFAAWLLLAVAFVMFIPAVVAALLLAAKALYP